MFLHDQEEISTSQGENLPFLLVLSNIKEESSLKEKKVSIFIHYMNNSRLKETIEGLSHIIEKLNSQDLAIEIQISIPLMLVCV